MTNFIYFFKFQAMLQYLEKLKQEDMDALIKKRGIQRSIMQDVARANEVSLLFETISGNYQLL